MLIDNSFLHFCAEKTREIEEQYDSTCIMPGEGEGFPRSPDALDTILQGIHGKPIFHRQLRIPASVAKYRSFYVPYANRIEIYYAAGLSQEQIRYYKTKELLQVHLWQESLVTKDVVELVQNMILRASPASIDLNLGHSATSDTLGEIAAMQFLFPIQRRHAHVKVVREGNGMTQLARDYGIPPYIVQACFNNMELLSKFFEPGPSDASETQPTE